MRGRSDEGGTSDLCGPCEDGVPETCPIQGVEFKNGFTVEELLQSGLEE